MTGVRPPRRFTNQSQDPLSAALEQEILNEKVSTLSRLNRKLEAALASLAAAHTDAGERTADYDQRLAEAGEALWHVTIQRELCGLHRHKSFYEHMGVPKAVILNMGPRKPRTAG